MKRSFELFTFWILLLSALQAAPLNSPHFASQTRVDTALFDINMIQNIVDNVGHTSTNAVIWQDGAQGGMRWGETQGSIIYCSGFWVVGKVANEARTASAEYASEFVPGSLGSKIDDPRHRVYKINRDGTGDWQSWPFDLGAPALKAVDGSDSLDATGQRIPELLGDQTLWWVMNDGDPAAHEALFNSQPLGVEVRTTVFGYAYPSPFDNMLFVRWQIFNENDFDIHDAYVCLWQDVDLGDATDDLVGCDTTRNLIFTYNDDADDTFGAAPPATGLLLLQGPVVSEPGANACQFASTLQDYKNLPITAFFGFG